MVGSRTPSPGQERPGDGVRVYEDGRKGWNKKAWDRQELANKMWRAETLRRMAARPDTILQTLVVYISEKASVPISYEEMWADGLGARYTAANTARNRWLVYMILDGLKVIPRSWGRSAALRFWRGTGKQANAKYPGGGILGTKWGWKAREAEAVSHIFYSGNIGALFMEDYSMDPYGAEAYAEDEFGDPLVDYDVRWKATLKERDEEFIKLLMGKLEEQGLEPYDAPPPKAKKPRKKKEWKAGDKIRQANLRDLTEGQHFKWTVVEFDYGSYNSDPRPAEQRTYEFVVSSRERGKVIVRPIIKGVAFGPTNVSSSSLYSAGYRWHSTEAVYQGEWAGTTVDVAAARGEWKPRKKKITVPNVALQERLAARAAREAKTRTN